MNLKKKPIYHICLLIFSYFLMYFLNNQFQFFPVTVLKPLWLDEKIPFNPYGVYFYTFAYIFPIVIFIRLYILEKYHILYFYFTHFFLVSIIANLIFLFFPTHLINNFSQLSYDELSSQSDFLTAFLLKTIYTLDRPYNCSPSLHVASALVATFTLFWDKRLYFITSLILTLAICHSTMQVKQHLSFDLYTGILLALVTWLLLRLLFIKKYPYLK